MDRKEIAKDFEPLRDRCLAIILYGSQVEGEAAKKSDIDICILAPEDPKGVFGAVLSSGLTERYDVKIFELLPLKIKGSILERHVLIWTSDEAELSDYLHKWRRVWEDQKMALRKLGIEIFT